jgi:hypothetical protein
MLLAACGGGGGSGQLASVAQIPSGQTQGAPTTDAAVQPAQNDAPAAAATTTNSKATQTVHAAALSPQRVEQAAAAPVQKHKGSGTATAAKVTGSAPASPAAGAAPAQHRSASLPIDPRKHVANNNPNDLSIDTPADEKINAAKQGITDIGVTKDEVRFGGVNMHGMALGNILITPIVGAIRAAMASINDRGGVLGRRMSFVDCDDGPGEVGRAKACIKKLVGQDHIFGLIGGATWATASMHDDLRQYHLPFFGIWAYSQTEWQDPFMFPTHMSMLHEALAGANWVRQYIKPKTYGLICLTSPEMQLACANVRKVMDPVAKMVKQVDVSISETSMAAYVLAMRQANPDHIIHYVINPATMAKFVVESAQQGYWPPMGISGNHLMVEMLGSIFGKWPVGRYWTNTTYRVWGAEYIATMDKYSRANHGINNHVAQASYVGVLLTEQAMKYVGPNLTRDRIMAVMTHDHIWNSDASLDQKFSWRSSERSPNGVTDQDLGQGREFMYKYTDTNNVSNPDGTPNGWQLDRVIYTQTS